MAIEVLKILNEMCPPVLAYLVEKRSRSEGTRHQCYGTHFQMILENVQILINLKVLLYHGMVKIVIV